MTTTICAHSAVAFEGRDEAVRAYYPTGTLVAVCQECDFEREATADEIAGHAEAEYERIQRDRCSA